MDIVPGPVHPYLCVNFTIAKEDGSRQKKTSLREGINIAIVFFYNIVETAFVAFNLHLRGLEDMNTSKMVQLTYPAFDPVNGLDKSHGTWRAGRDDNASMLLKSGVLQTPLVIFIDASTTLLAGRRDR
ncbi:hypothetical protein TNCV_3812821 [Trichonephila clavipes]|nr:hypothetical protein TNCV_3812821 [Trichonephila clavipes]